MIQYLEIQKENNECFLLFRITLDNFDNLCRIWIDKFTANGFTDLFNTKRSPFKGVKIQDCKFVYSGCSLGKDEIYQSHNVEIIYNSKRHKIKLKCSTFFAQNLYWISGVIDPIELNYLVYQSKS